MEGGLVVLRAEVLGFRIQSSGFRVQVCDAIVDQSPCNEAEAPYPPQSLKTSCYNELLQGSGMGGFGDEMHKTRTIVSATPTFEYLFAVSTFTPHGISTDIPSISTCSHSHKQVMYDDI